MTAAYRLYGTTDDVTTCEVCGKPELKGTVMVQPLDADGNPEDIVYAGTTCAARLLAKRGRKVTGARIRAEAAAADARRAEAVTRSRDLLAFYEPYEADHAVLAAEYARHNRYYEHHPEADPLAGALESLARHREVIATAGASALHP